LNWRLSSKNLKQDLQTKVVSRIPHTKGKFDFTLGKYVANLLPPHTGDALESWLGRTISTSLAVYSISQNGCTFIADGSKLIVVERVMMANLPVKIFQAADFM
jgi:hypothetical protein